MVAKYAFMFPGQGSQKTGMGKELAEASSAAREIFERADNALEFSLSKLCFEGPDSELALTANTQPAILTCSIAALAALRERVEVEPALALGHSLGEFSALVSVGALKFEDAVRLVRLRGQAMQEAVPAGEGSMGAVLKLDLETVEDLCRQASEGEVLAPANVNGGGQIVVAGHVGAIQRLTALAKDKGGRVLPLKVSAPFHCSLMQPAAERLERALEDIEIGEMVAPVISNVEAEPNRDGSRVKGLLVKQVTHRVRWEESVRKVLHMDLREGLEIGHGKVLAGLVKRISGDLSVVPVGSPSDIDVLHRGT